MEANIRVTPSEAFDWLEIVGGTRNQSLKSARVVSLDKEVIWCDLSEKYDIPIPVAAWGDQRPPEIDDKILLMLEIDYCGEAHSLRVTEMHSIATPRAFDVEAILASYISLPFTA